ncbi:MAG: TIGR00725 family protein [Nitrospinae bacterium]|nr:TIGR00725 family protein [Nitrospinota bacterium]
MIGVIGASFCGPDTAEKAYEIGKLLAQRGAALVCGGLGGVMEAASKGASEAGGLVIGVLPGADTRGMNQYVRVPVITNMGHGRNVIIAHTAMGLVAVDGEYGTLSEIAVALKLGKPVAALGAWSGVKGVMPCATPGEAVENVFNRLGLR